MLINFFFSKSLRAKIYYLVGLSYIVRPKKLFIKFNWPWSPSLGNCKNLEEMWSTKIYWRVCKDFLTQLYIPCTWALVICHGLSITVSWTNDTALVSLHCIILLQAGILSYVADDYSCPQCGLCYLCYCIWPQRTYFLAAVI